MRAFMTAMVIALAVLFVPQSSTAEELSSVQSDSLIFPHILLSIKDDDPSTETLRFYFNGGASLRVKQENIDRVVDASETPGRVYITFRATSEIPEELEKFHAWDFKHARTGSYKAVDGAESIRPEVKILVTFPSNGEENKYVMGFESPEEDGTIYRPAASSTQLSADKEATDVGQAR